MRAGLNYLTPANPIDAEVLRLIKDKLCEVIDDLDGNHTPPPADEQTIEDVRRVAQQAPEWAKQLLLGICKGK